jgi:hypothetical protein
VFLYSVGDMFWNTIKETMNFLSSANARTSGGEGKRDGDVWRTIERY